VVLFQDRLRAAGARLQEAFQMQRGLDLEIVWPEKYPEMTDPEEGLYLSLIMRTMMWIYSGSNNSSGG
jgi:hypothetical protein